MQACASTQGAQQVVMLKDSQLQHEWIQMGGQCCCDFDGKHDKFQLTCWGIKLVKVFDECCMCEK